MPTLHSTLGTKGRSELDDRSCLGFLAGVSSELICNAQNAENMYIAPGNMSAVDMCPFCVCVLISSVQQNTFVDVRRNHATLLSMTMSRLSEAHGHGDIYRKTGNRNYKIMSSITRLNVSI